MQPNDKRRLLIVMSCFMLLFIAWQLSFLSIHYGIANIFQSLTGSPISHSLLQIALLRPILANILIQLTLYALIIFIISRITVAIGNTLHLSRTTTYYTGLLCLILAMLSLLAFNSALFPLSFFSLPYTNPYLLWSLALFWLAAFIIAFRQIKWLLFGFVAVNGLCLIPSYTINTHHATSQPNIILIGLDSLRPDFTGFYGNKKIQTPTIDAFLNQSIAFDEVYTPLARTFPSWMSILTAQHPKQHGARNNLADIRNSNETLATRLQQAGYYTLYATDEKRFSNLKQSEGFDKLAGPNMGIHDFILGGLLDFPITNLLTQLPIAAYLLPYNYGNRAANITYQPEQFLSLVNTALVQRPDKPLFLAIHLCLSHWPYTWASGLGEHETQPEQYQHSVEAVDKQLNELLTLLRQQGLLDNSIVVLLSDHGTALGLPNDTLLNLHHYHGNKKLLGNIPAARLSSAPSDSADFKHDYTINTSYGQGTNITSLKQYHPLLAIRRCGESTLKPQRINTPVSLTDIAPTVLAILKLPPLPPGDGQSLTPLIKGGLHHLSSRAFFIETGDSLSEIETDHIYLEKVLARKASLYRIDEQGLLTIDPIAERAIIKSKQRAIIAGDWLLARYPANTRSALVPSDKHTAQLTYKTINTPPYYILVNLKTGDWTIDLNTRLAKTAPVAMLSKKLQDFYGDEM